MRPSLRGGWGGGGGRVAGGVVQRAHMQVLCPATGCCPHCVQLWN